MIPLRSSSSQGIEYQSVHWTFQAVSKIVTEDWIGEVHHAWRQAASISCIAGCRTSCLKPQSQPLATPKSGHFLVQNNTIATHLKTPLKNMGLCSVFSNCPNFPFALTVIEISFHLPTELTTTSFFFMRFFVWSNFTLPQIWPHHF